MTTVSTTTTAAAEPARIDAGRDRLGGGGAPAPARANARQGRPWPIILMLVASLIAAGFVRSGALAYQQRISKTNPYAGTGQSALGGMNSFSLALLLGGLRGPLVMFLWSTSESQKTDKNLEDFNTKVEWIRLLQPEFDTVHIFQIWNLAYNISVQMASLPNRYAAILEALDYARNVDQARPDNLNIMHAIAQVYSNKLGTVAQEKNYYRRRVREDSLPRKMTGPRFGEAGFQRRRMDPLLDESFRIRPEYLVVRHPRPADLPPNAEWNTGQELQYLERYGTFPYGVSTFALGYNYAKRAEVLMNVGKQKPLQLSENVIDSRPALELKTWAEDDWERARRFEIEGLGLQVPTERLDMEMPTASLALDRTIADDKYDAAVYSYEMVQRLVDDARAEYQRHLNNPAYFDKTALYESHLQAIDAMKQLSAADVAYLRAMRTLDPAERQRVLTQAADAYRAAIGTYQLIVMRHYIDDEVAKELFGGTRLDSYDLPAERRNQAYQALRKRDETISALEPAKRDTYWEDRMEYDTHIRRAEARLAVIANGGRAPAAAPLPTLGQP